MTGFRAGVMALVALALSACMAPPPPKPTVVNLAITGAANMNATGAGKGTPAKVQVFYLQSDAKFNATDFFALNENAAAALGPDLLATDEYFLQPGLEVTDVKTFDTPTPKIGVIAAFRNVDQPGWKASAPIPQNATSAANVTIGASSVEVAVAPAGGV